MTDPLHHHFLLTAPSEPTGVVGLNARLLLTSGMNEQVSVINVNIVSSHARLEMAPIRHAAAHRHPHIQPRLDRTNFTDNNGNRNRNEECSSEKWFTHLRMVPPLPRHNDLPAAK